MNCYLVKVNGVFQVFQTFRSMKRGESKQLPTAFVNKSAFNQSDELLLGESKRSVSNVLAFEFYETQGMCDFKTKELINQPMIYSVTKSALARFVNKNIGVNSIYTGVVYTFTGVGVVQY